MDILKKTTALILLIIIISTVLLTLFASEGITQLKQQKLLREASNAEQEFKHIIHRDVETISIAIEIISKDKEIKNAFKNKDRNLLNDLTKPLFEKLRIDYDITKFYFIEPNGEVFLRPHNPEYVGGIINRESFRTAQRTQKISSGIELDNEMWFVERVVLPYYDEEKLIGYIELGKDITNALDEFKTITGNNLVILRNKNTINKQNWINAINKDESNNNWNNLEEYVILSNPELKLNENILEQTKKCIKDVDISKINREEIYLTDYLKDTTRCAITKLNGHENSLDMIMVYFIDLKNIELITRTIFDETSPKIAIMYLTILTTFFLFIYFVFIKRIKKITNTIKKISKGEIDAELDSKLKKSTDEIGELARAFDRTIVSLKLAMKQTSPTLQKEKIELEELLEAKEKAEKQASQYLDVANAIIIALDLKGNITLVNRKGCEVLSGKKYCLEQPYKLKGKNWFDTFILEENKKEVKEVFNKIIQGNLAPVEYYENEIKTLNGEKKLIAWHNSILKNSNEEIIGVISSGQDITKKRKNEKQLKESENRFKDITKTAKEWIWETNADGEYTYSNSVVKELLGYEPNEVIGKKFYDFFLPEEKEEFKQTALKIFNNKESFNGFINKLLTKDGKIRWVSTNGTPILDKHGKLIGYRGSDVNITEEKLTKKLLKESKIKFEEIYNKSPIGIELYDADGKFIDTNQSALTIFGILNKEELKRFNLFKDPNIPKSLIKKLKNGKQIEYEVPFDFELVKKNKLYKTTKSGIIHIHTIITPIKDVENNKIRSYLVQVQDTTKQKQLMNSIKESENKFKKIFEESPEAIIILDKQGKIINANKKLKEWIGYSLEEIKGLHISDLPIVSKISKVIALKNFISRMSGRKIPPYDLEFLSKDGRIITGRINAAPIRDEKTGKIIQDIIIITNLDEHKLKKQNKNTINQNNQE